MYKKLFVLIGILLILLIALLPISAWDVYEEIPDSQTMNGTIVWKEDGGTGFFDYLVNVNGTKYYLNDNRDFNEEFFVGDNVTMVGKISDYHEWIWEGEFKGEYIEIKLDPYDDGTDGYQIKRIDN